MAAGWGLLSHGTVGNEWSDYGGVRRWCSNCSSVWPSGLVTLLRTVVIQGHGARAIHGNGISLSTAKVKRDRNSLAWGLLRIFSLDASFETRRINILP